MLPQMDQFYKEHIWPIAKFAIGSSLMGPMGVVTSAIANTIAMNGISAVEQAWMNNVFGNPLFEDVKINFAAILDYVPGLCLGGYDYISNYITHNVYGMW